MEQLSQIFGIVPKNIELYKAALTHPSFTKSNSRPYNECYERLEFIGDAVLKLLVSDVLFELYPEYSEGKMSKIRSIVVSDNMISQVAKEKGLNNLIIFSKHEEKQGCRNLNSVCACSFEALLGAYYLDGYYKELKDFIKKEFSKYISEVDKNFEKYNSKEILQEYTQKYSGITPDYKIVNESGPAHNKIFYVEVIYNNEVLGTGNGSSKKEAEQNAAYCACEKLGII